MVSMVTGLASLTSRTSMGVLVVGGVVRKHTRTRAHTHARTHTLPEVDKSQKEFVAVISAKAFLFLLYSLKGSAVSIANRS